MGRYPHVVRSHQQLGGRQFVAVTVPGREGPGPGSVNVVHADIAKGKIDYRLVSLVHVLVKLSLYC